MKMDVHSVHSHAQQPARFEPQTYLEQFVTTCPYKNPLHCTNDEPIGFETVKPPICRNPALRYLDTTSPPRKDAPSIYMHIHIITHIKENFVLFLIPPSSIPRSKIHITTRPIDLLPPPPPQHVALLRTKKTLVSKERCSFPFRCFEVFFSVRNFGALCAGLFLLCFTIWKNGQFGAFFKYLVIFVF